MKTTLFKGLSIFFLSVSLAAAQKPSPPKQGASPATERATQASEPSSVAQDLYTQPDEGKRAQAYAEFMLGHFDERQYEATGNSDYLDQAIEHYKKAMTFDPAASEITEQLAEAYAESQRISDAVEEAQKALEQNPDNLDARRLLAHIYIRNLGDMSHAADQKESIAKAIEQFEAIEHRDPSDTESGLWLARLYGFENQFDKSEQVLRGILNRSPDDEGALEQLSKLLLDEGRSSEAAKLLEPAAGRTDSPTLYDLLGSAESQTHDYAEAEQAYRKAIETEPNEASHRKGLAQTLLSEDKYREALEQYKRLTQIEPDEAENYLRMSQIYRHLDELDQAEGSLALAKQHAPESLEVLYNEALLDEAQGRFKDAVGILSDAIAGIKAEQRPGEAPPNALAILYEQLGLAYRDEQNYDAAARTFEDMRQIGPKVEERAELLLIDTYRASHDIDRAIAEAQKAMKDDPADQEYTVNYAMLLGEKGKIDAANQVLRGLLKGKQNNREIYLDLAQVEERGRQYAEAEENARTALEMSTEPNEKEKAWFLLGAIYERQKKYDEAEAEFRKALEANPHDPIVLNYYGYMLADRGLRLEEATLLIAHAVMEDPANGAYLDSLGWAYYKQNKLAEAEKYLERAVQHSGQDPTILGHLGEVYEKLGQSGRAEQTWEKALAQWQKALPADYEPDQVAKLNAKLKTLKQRLAQSAGTGESKPQ